MHTRQGQSCGWLSCQLGAPVTERARYPELGMMIDLRRIDVLGDARIPDWLQAGAGVGARRALMIGK